MIKVRGLTKGYGRVRAVDGPSFIRGRPFEAFAEPLREVGALLDPVPTHSGRSGRDHLRVAARTSGIPRRRVGQVIEQVGLGSAARRRIRTYSLAAVPPPRNRAVPGGRVPRSDRYGRRPPRLGAIAGGHGEFLLAVQTPPMLPARAARIFTARLLARTCAAEWARLWTVRTPWWFLAAAVGTLLAWCAGALALGWLRLRSGR